MQIVRIGDGSSKRHSADVVGAKAANLSHMAALGLPVPPAFVLPVNLCAAIVRGDSHAKQQLAVGLREGIEFLEGVTGKLFGDRRRPLLVSVRSGAARSMPGMLDTVLDVGCTLEAVHGLVRMTGHPRFAWDCRRRFIESYAHVVLGVDMAEFTGRRGELVAAEGAAGAQALDSEATERLARSYQELVEDDDFTLPEDPMEQLESAAKAVYRSWMSDRATHLSPARASGRLGRHRGHRASDGVRQPRADLGRRRRLLARSIDRRGATDHRRLVRVAGRRRRLRQPQPGNRGGDCPFAAGGSDAIARNAGAARTRICRRAGYRIHHRRRQIVDAADPLGQAHAAGRAALRDRLRQGRPAHAGASLAPAQRRRFGQARPPAAHRCACADRARDTPRRQGSRSDASLSIRRPPNGWRPAAIP